MTDDAVRTTIHKSLARGAARMVLREGYREMEDRLLTLPDVESVIGEHSARRFAATALKTFGDRLVFIRTELAGKGSDVMAIGLDTRVNDGHQELTLFGVTSQKGAMKLFWLDYMVAHHALERFQQRRLGVAHQLSSFVDEFSPTIAAGLLSVGNVKSSRSRETQLHATATGALISIYDEKKQARLGVTWLALEQLRPEQIVERQEGIKTGRNFFSELQACRRNGKFAGQRDRVLWWIRKSPAMSEIIPAPTARAQ